MQRAFLKIVAGARQGMNVPLSPDAPLHIGRREGELLVDDPLVSGRHCRVFSRGGEWVLQDVGSTNGTMVDGRLVREVVLRPGQEIALGATRLVLFTTGDDEPAEPSAPSPSAATDEEGGLGAQEAAWLLDEELVEIAGPSERTRGSADVIGQDLRLPPGVTAHLEVVAGADSGRVYRFARGNVSIGRHTGEVALSDGEVSRRHAVVEVFGRDMVFLRDLGSTNGTYHNGRRTHVARMQPGDTVGVGKTVLKLEISR